MIEINVNQVPMFRRGFRLQWEPTQNSHVILYPEGMATLNESAAMILENVDGKRPLSEIIDGLNQRFPEAGGVDDDVKEFFAQGYEQKWIIFREPA